MRLVAQLLHRNNKQTVLLASVTAHQRRAVVSAGLVGAQHFLGQRLVEVDEQVLVELQVTHLGLQVIFIFQVSFMCSKPRNYDFSIGKTKITAAF